MALRRHSAQGAPGDDRLERLDITPNELDPLWKGFEVLEPGRTGGRATQSLLYGLCKLGRERGFKADHGNPGLQIAPAHDDTIRGMRIDHPSVSGIDVANRVEPVLVRASARDQTG